MKSRIAAALCLAAATTTAAFVAKLAMEQKGEQAFYLGFVVVTFAAFGFIQLFLGDSTEASTVTVAEAVANYKRNNPR